MLIIIKEGYREWCPSLIILDGKLEILGQRRVVAVGFGREGENPER